MISYRHHIVSLVAVFLALAVGVALGGGPLSELGRDDRPASATTRQQRAATSGASFGDEFAAASAAALYDGGLRDHSVSVVTLPGASGDVVSALGAQVEAAGGEIAGTYDVLPALTDPEEKSLVDTLGSQLMTQLGSGAVTSDASTYVRLGQLVGLATATTDLPSEDALSVRQSLAGAELLTSPEDAMRAPIVLVVLGTSTNPAILSGLVAGLSAKASGVVVAGDAAAAAGSGDLAALRSEPAADKVATVDGADTPLGQVTTVLALIRSISVKGGAFGASGSDGAVPLK
ncbi:copper transporter [Nocardioides sp. T2.26MG-1]|uniref:copper transporter n=1 Tax=Nocardioides sp. T2.26MG-1 TaxID=3041166 RepID=UPI0024776F3A|nr:copper transporter [Nocardioides sp. T2.26MG-1]CAI9415282.1 Copper transporter MctB [Nocardioides sp. T2.26MG-1]